MRFFFSQLNSRNDVTELYSEDSVTSKSFHVSTQEYCVKMVRLSAEAKFTVHFCDYERKKTGSKIHITFNR